MNCSISMSQNHNPISFLMASRRLILCLLFIFFTTDLISAKKKPRHLHFYMHKNGTGPNPNSVIVAKGPIPLPGTPFNFGDLIVFDSPLTEDPNPTSNLVGRAQGMFAIMKTEPSVEWIVNLVLTYGEYNGSALAIVARDLVTLPVRELPVISGSGTFRMARGFVLLKTYYLDNITGDTVLELDVYVYPGDE